MQNLKTYKLMAVTMGFLLVSTNTGCSKLFAEANREVPPTADTWMVMKVSDGDTLKVRQTDGREMKIRLACIDAPETAKGQQPGQPLAEESKAFLQKLIADADNQVGVVAIDRDHYGRTVAEIYISVNGQEKFINEELVLAGMAYRYTSKKCPNHIAITNAEAIAKAERKGVWGRINILKTRNPPQIKRDF